MSLQKQLFFKIQIFLYQLMVNSLNIEALGNKEKYNQDTPIEVFYNPVTIPEIKIFFRNFHISNS
ncbi:hypothetical protein [Algibacter sp. L4_22]|uniref:hypothetical protein n=1 Tax=Algibacter sp. L4_22 TaxID=2942477 RepID=UPI00201B7B41|nr:hypothetical protein [Algibacter sp. L4_22]MCL5130339.1 hypothetical protein [Algibacter sp. L4_22]